MRIASKPSFLPSKDRYIYIFIFYLNVIYLFFKNYLFILLYNIVLVLPYIDLNPPLVYMCYPFWTPLPTPSPSHLFLITPEYNQERQRDIAYIYYTG